MDPDSLVLRVASLERRLRRLQALTVTSLLAAAALALAGLTSQPAAPASQPPAAPKPSIQDEVRTRKLVVVDDQDKPRIIIQQDPANTQRRSRAMGITIADHTGAERGGFGTMDDGSAVFAMDAPTGVGSPSRDRVGMVVWPDGAADIVLFDNQSRTAACLHSDGQAGALQLLKWDADKGQARALTFDGDRAAAYEGFGKTKEK